MVTIAGAVAVGRFDDVVVVVARYRVKSVVSSAANMCAVPRLRQLGRAQTDRQTCRPGAESSRAEQSRAVTWCRCERPRRQQRQQYYHHQQQLLLLLVPESSRRTPVTANRRTATSVASIRQVQLAAVGTVWTAANSRSHARLFVVLLCADEAAVPAAAAGDWRSYSRMTSF